MTKRRIGQVLVSDGTLSDEAVQRALAYQEQAVEPFRLGSILLNWKLVAEDSLVAALAKLHGCEPVCWAELSRATPEALRCLLADRAMKLGAVPYSLEGTLLRVAFRDPSDLAAVDEVAQVSQKRVIPAVTSEASIALAHRRFYGRPLPIKFRLVIQKLESPVQETTKLRIGQVLVSEGTLSDEAVKRALAYQENAAETFRLGSILLNWDMVAEDSLVAALAKLHACEPVCWAELSRATPEALQCLPADRATKLGAVPYSVDGTLLRVAFLDPSDLAAVDEVSQVSQKRVIPAATTEAGIALAHRRFYGHALPIKFRLIIQKLERDRQAPAGSSRAGEVEAHWPFWTPEESSPGSLGHLFQVEPDDSLVPPPQDPGDEFFGPPGALTRGRVADALLEMLLVDFPRVVVFGVGKTEITGWNGRGPGLVGEAVAAICVPRQGESLLAEVARTGMPYFGQADAKRLPPEIAPAGGTCICAIFPIYLLNEVAGLLYADRMGGMMPQADFPLLARGAAHAAGWLSRFLLEEADA
jgi:hypothetical protein